MNLQELSVDHLQEILFQQQYETGELGSDPHIIACGNCGERVDCLSSGTGACINCGTLHFRGEHGEWYVTEIQIQH